jgi:hypothetical protein
MNYVILIINKRVVNLRHQINTIQYEKNIYNKWGTKIRAFRRKI